MARKFGLVLLLLLLSAGGNWSMAESPDENGFIDCWLICGPFPNAGALAEKDWLIENGGEEKMETKEGMRCLISFHGVKAGGATNVWRTYKSGSGKSATQTQCAGAIDLLKAFDIDETKTNVVGYVFCVVNAPDDREAVLSFGSDDGYKIWLNHRLVAVDSNIHRSIKADENKFSVSLKKGRNPLLVKIYQNVGGYGFALRFLSRDAGAIMDDLDITRH